MVVGKVTQLSIIGSPALSLSCQHDGEFDLHRATIIVQKVSIPSIAIIYTLLLFLFGEKNDHDLAHLQATSESPAIYLTPKTAA